MWNFPFCACMQANFFFDWLWAGVWLIWWWESVADPRVSNTGVHIDTAASHCSQNTLPKSGPDVSWKREHFWLLGLGFWGAWRFLQLPLLYISWCLSNVIFCILIKKKRKCLYFLLLPITILLDLDEVYWSLVIIEKRMTCYQLYSLHQWTWFLGDEVAFFFVVFLGGGGKHVAGTMLCDWS